MNWLNRCHFGDVRDVLRRMIAEGVKVQTIVTSPPYWGLRSYLPAGHADKTRKLAAAGSGTKNNDSMDEALEEMRSTRNRRSVWTVASEPYKGAHFATFPRALIEPCILAGAPAGGVVLDIFMGSGTTAQVAEQLGRKWIGIDIDQRNAALQAERLRQPSLDLEAA